MHHRQCLRNLPIWSAEEITESEELKKKEKLKTKWAALDALVDDSKRIALIAADLVSHLTPSPPAQAGCGQPCLNAMGSPYKVLVAFTDVVKDAKDGQEYTEAKMNGFPEAATGDIEKRMKDEVEHLVRPFFHPSSFNLQPCSWRRIWRRLPRSGSVPSEVSRRTKAW